jgi:TonB family protein
MRSYLYGSLAAHLAATLLWGVVSMVLREPLQPVELIQVDLATLPVVKPVPEEPKPLPEPTPKPVEELRPEPTAVPPEPKVVPDKRPEPELVEELEAEDSPPEEIVPPDPELPPPPEHKKPEPSEDLDFLEPDEVAPPVTEEIAEAQEEAPPASTPVPTAGVQVEKQEGLPDYYLALMQNKINRRWEPSAARTRGGAQAQCSIRFRVSRAGEILEPRLVESSGLSVFDREALSAVIASSPLPPPPAGSRVTEMPITVRFNLDR